MLAAGILVLRGPKERLVAGFPPSAGSSSSSSSSSLLSSPLTSSPPSLWTPDLFIHLSLSRPGKLDLPPRTHTPLICPTSLAMWLLNLFSCVCVCVRLSHTLWCFSLLPVVILPLLYPFCLPWGLHTLSLLPSGAVSGSQKGAATGHGDNGGGPYRSDSVKSMVTEGVKAGRWQTVQGHVQSGGLRPSE